MKHLTKKVSLFFVAFATAFLFVTIAPINTLGIENTNVVEAATKINTKKINLPKGSKYTLKITGTSNSVKWSTSKSSVATVKNGVVTAKKAGTATITAKVGSKKYTCTVKVLNWKVNTNNVVMTKGKTYKLKVSGTSKKPTFLSSNTSVATVSKTSGKITAKNNGTTTITVKVGSDSFRVTVKVETPSINKKMITLYKGNTYALKVNTSRKVTWSSNNTSVATVSSSGKVTAKKSGTAVITAKISDKLFTCTVKVGNKTAINCADSITLDWGQTVTYNITAGDSCKPSVSNDNVSVTISPQNATPGTIQKMTVTGDKIGDSTIIFVCDNGWKKVVSVKVKPTETTLTLDTTTPNGKLLNNMVVNNFKAYKGTGTKPSINVVGSITNNSPDKLQKLEIVYYFYDDYHRLTTEYYHCIDNPVKGKTYNFSDLYKPSDKNYPEGATQVILACIIANVDDSLKDATVNNNVPISINSNDSGCNLENITLKQNYLNTYNYRFNFDYNVTLTNTPADSDIYIYFYFYDKDGNILSQADYKYAKISTGKDSTVTQTGTITDVWGCIKNINIAYVKLNICLYSP